MRRLWKALKEAQEQGQLLNQRQKLFLQPVVPFENLTKLIKEFEPYKNLWVTASGNKFQFTFIKLMKLLFFRLASGP